MTAKPSLDSFHAKDSITIHGKTYTYYSLKKAQENGLGDVSKLPFTLKVLLENLLRFEDGSSVTKKNIQAIASWLSSRKSKEEIAYRPSRVLMQDFTGVPAVVDLAAMRDAVKALGGDPKEINPLIPVDLVIDHSIIVEDFGNKEAMANNIRIEYERNLERYAFLKWSANSFRNFKVVPPGTGICHQVNIEYLASTVQERDGVLFPDTCIGTDSHTTMVNGLAVLAWGVGGIEAEAAMLGQPVSMLIPEVVGFQLNGKLQEGVTATDLVLFVTNILRSKGVVGKFVEFFGEGLSGLTLEDRATISNMAPEYGATCGFFPIDHETLHYLTEKGRSAEQVAIVEAYAKAQGMFHEHGASPSFTDVVELALEDVVPTLAGPKRPQDKIALKDAAGAFKDLCVKTQQENMQRLEVKHGYAHEKTSIANGDVVIAAITSCTNTSNPNVLIAAGLLARKAIARGLTKRPWVKTSLAPGSQVVTDYLAKTGLDKDLDALGFSIVGYGCTTCIGNSGPLAPEISKVIQENHLNVVSVLSGNRNFEGRINPDVQSNYLASPPLVVAYAITGSMHVNLATEPLGKDPSGKDVYLKDIWPSNAEIAQMVRGNVTKEMFVSRYAHVFVGDAKWQEIPLSTSETYAWDDRSTYVRNPPYFVGMEKEPAPINDIHQARVLALFGDSITTDHISPAGSIKTTSPAGKYLTSHEITPFNFNSYGTRRGNHEVMMRGTFANTRIKNLMMQGKEGGLTKHQPSGEEMTIYDAAMRYREENVPLVIFAGKEYGSGSSRDWAAKGPKLLGVQAVIVESFERIHRSNLVGMGILPLQFQGNDNITSLQLDGTEKVTITGFADLAVGGEIAVVLTRKDGTTKTIQTKVKIDTAEEMAYFRNGGILHYVLRGLANA